MRANAADDHLLRAATLALAALATGSAELALAEPGTAPAWPLVRAAVLAAVAATLSRFLGRPRLGARRSATSPLVVGGLLVAFAWPFAAEAARWGLAGRTATREVVALSALRNLGLGLAALAQCLGGRFARVQCTPDLLPGDVTGFRVYDQKTREFEFLPGPVFADVLLTDEINRATPRTQSALLEAMAERQVTVDSVRHVLSETFFVIATQNPVEQHGTYPLPEAQLDRFAMKLRIGYPRKDDERAMLDAAVGTLADGPEEAPPALAPGRLRALQEAVASVAVGPLVRDYLIDLAAASRSHRQVTLGLSPRGLLTWQRLAQARALLQGRTYATPDDVQDVAGPVLGVRLGIEPEASGRVLAEIQAAVPVPVTPAPAARS